MVAGKAGTKRIAVTAVLTVALAGCSAYSVGHVELEAGGPQIEIRLRVDERYPDAWWACTVEGPETVMDAGRIDARSPSVIVDAPPGRYVVRLRPKGTDPGRTIAVVAEGGWKTVLEFRGIPIGADWSLSDEGSAAERAAKAWGRFLYGVIMIGMVLLFF